VTPGLETVVAVTPVVVGLGGGFMISPEMKAAVKDGGYNGWSLYLAGRAGVLGPTTADVVVAALPFHSPDLVTRGWEAGLAVRPVDETVDRYVAVCHEWGRNRYSDVDGVARLADLLARVVDAADPQSDPLYAGWRAVPLPDDAPARVCQLLHVLREHRGAAHLSAIRLAELSPVEAIIAGPGGIGNATFFGWSPPWPEVDEGVQARRAKAEQVTDELVAPAYAVLAPPEATELAELLGRAADAVTARGPIAALTGEALGRRHHG
jgi:hypothetical protein